MYSGKLVFSQDMDLLSWDNSRSGAAFTLVVPAVAAAVQIPEIFQLNHPSIRKAAEFNKTCVRPTASATARAELEAGAS